jgi:cytochrome P450
MGPKFCINNNFATMEIIIIVTKVVWWFQLLPSPNYRHHLTTVMVLQSKYGMPIILKIL